MNCVSIVGRLTADPEVKYTDGGKTIAKFCVAVDRKVKTEDKEKATDFINCVAWAKTAEFIEKYFHKGMRIGLNGRIQTGSYTNKDNKKVYTTDVVAENVEFVESKGSGEQAAPQQVNDGFLNIPQGIEEDLPFH